MTSPLHTPTKDIIPNGLRGDAPRPAAAPLTPLRNHYTKGLRSLVQDGVYCRLLVTAATCWQAKGWKGRLLVGKPKVVFIADYLMTRLRFFVRLLFRCIQMFNCLKTWSASCSFKLCNTTETKTSLPVFRISRRYKETLGSRLKKRSKKWRRRQSWVDIIFKIDKPWSQLHFPNLDPSTSWLFSILRLIEKASRRGAGMEVAFSFYELCNTTSLCYAFRKGKKGWDRG